MKYRFLLMVSFIFILIFSFSLFSSSAQDSDIPHLSHGFDRMEGGFGNEFKEFCVRVARGAMLNGFIEKRAMSVVVSVYEKLKRGEFDLAKSDVPSPICPDFVKSQQGDESDREKSTVSFDKRVKFIDTDNGKN